MSLHRRFRSMHGLVVAAAAVTMFSGCLSLGGRTTYVQDSPETTARLSALEAQIGALETRFAALERTVFPGPPPSQQPPPGAPYGSFGSLPPVEQR